MYDIYNTKFNIVVKLLGMWCKSTQFHPCCKEDKESFIPLACAGKVLSEEESKSEC